VLIAGGFATVPIGTATALQSAELFDPVTNTFSSAGTLVAGRSMHSATLLSDGTTLLAGGLDVANITAISSAELFSTTFAATGAMPTAHAQHTATLLSDGTVLIAGGGAWGLSFPLLDVMITGLTQAEIYSPGTGTFAATTPLSHGRFFHTATMLNTGKVLLTGGAASGGGGALASAELFSPSACAPTTCAAAGKNCGSLSDGCGGTLDCGACTAPQTCGGGGTANVCGCTPTTCAAAGANCGSISNGCGGTIDCGSCTAPQTCGGGGTANVCGGATCTPTTCAAAGANCGSIANGCGGMLDCGSCAAPESCGGSGQANVCGVPGRTW
jgi:hypothetical protein